MHLKTNTKWISALVCLFLVACGDDSDNAGRTGELTKEEARSQSGQSDAGADLCQVYSWYGDGVCDDFCPQRDEDCTATCASNAECASGEFCGFEAGLCGGDGICKSLPDVCSAIFFPVCGCDGDNYENACSASSVGVSVLSEGECGTNVCSSSEDCAAGLTCELGICVAPSEACNTNEDCENGEICVGGLCTASNASCEENANCEEGEYCHFDVSNACGASGDGECRVTPEVCSADFNPVCGCDDQTYSNACVASGAGVSVNALGACN